MGPLVVGIDPHLHLLPDSHRARWESLSGVARRRAAAEAVTEWSLEVVKGLSGRVAMVKPQVALFEQLGSPGVAALETVCAAVKEAGMLLLVDAKRGDIGSTAEAYARAILDDDGPIGADAVTISPYLGRDSIAPFLKRCEGGDKGLFVLLRTSNPGGAELQKSGGPSPAELVASWAAEWNRDITAGAGLGPVGVVAGATLGEELRYWRERLEQSWFLMPGYGAQGASALDTMTGFREDGLGGLVNSSRGVIFPRPEERSAYEEEIAGHVARRTDECRAELFAVVNDS